MSSSQLTSEELLKIANNEPDIINIRLDHSNVIEFIKEYNIESGEEKVPNYKIYFDYCNKWLPRGLKISKIGFFRKFKKAFSQKRINNVRYYLIKQGVFDTTEDSLNEAKLFDSRYRTRIKNGTVGYGKRKGQDKEKSN